jgi:hypothetical protein
MHKIVFGLVAGAALSLASAAFAADASPATAQASNDPNEVICKDAAAETGSMLGKRRICMSRAQWQAQQDSDRQEINNAQQHSLMARPAGG